MHMIRHQHLGMNGNLVTHGAGNGCFQIELSEKGSDPFTL